MGLIDKLRHITEIPDENYYPGDDSDMVGNYNYNDGYEDQPENEDDIYAAQETHAQRRVRYNEPAAEREPAGRVVDINANSRSQVVFKKLDKFDDVGGVADELNKKKIVILNLETCPNDVSRRVLDFLCGVAYANSGSIQRVAGRAYIITPNNVPVNGELLDEIENNGGAF